jgi:deoxyguanosine kinase
MIGMVGAPGSGKTTLAQWLATALGGRLLLEDYAGNPFLAESYAGRKELRLAGQTWFLLSRVNQLARLRWPKQGIVVTDYAFLQDSVYAHLWLTGEPLATYERLAAEMAGLVAEPSVLVYLDAPLDLLTSRIAGRGRDYEAYFTRDFLQRLCDEYARVLTDPPCPVIVVDVAQRDLALPAHRQWLLEELRRIRNA